MKRGVKYRAMLCIRLGEEDLRHLEAIAERERANISVVARRFIAEGLDREAGGRAPKRGGRGKKR